MRLRKRLCAISLASIMLFTTACGGGSSNGSKDGQTINAAFDADPTTLDPQKGSDVYGNDVIVNTFEPLLRLKDGKDGATEIVKAAASDYKVSEDGLTYTFTIRDGMKWDDGKPLTAKDFEYGIKRTADPKTGAESAFLLEPIKNFKAVNNAKTNTPLDQLGVKAIDDKTLEIKLEAPTEYFLRLVPFRVMLPQRQDIVEKFGDKYGSEADCYIGCGPYKLTEWVHGSKLTLVKSDTYWNKDSIKNDQVDVKVINDPTAVMNAFENGEIDKCKTTKVEWINKFDKDDTAEKHKVGLPSIDYLTINHKNKLLSNKKIRLAMLLALDRKDFNKTLFSGANKEAEYWIPEAIDVEGENYRNSAGKPFDSLRSANPDPKKLFIEGMKELGLGEDPSKVSIEFICVNNPQVKKNGEYIQQCYNKVLGINIKLEMMEWPILASRVNKADYQIGYLAWTADYNDPSAMLSLFKSDAGAVNTGWSNAEYDSLVTKGTRSKDAKSAIENYKKAEQILMDEAVIIPVISAEASFYNKKYLKGSMFNQFSTMGFQTQYIENK